MVMEIQSRETTDLITSSPTPNTYWVVPDSEGIYWAKYTCVLVCEFLALYINDRRLQFMSVFMFLFYLLLYPSSWILPFWRAVKLGHNYKLKQNW